MIAEERMDYAVSLEEHMLKRGYSHKTFLSYLYCLKRLIKFTGKDPYDMTYDDVHNFQVNYKKNFNDAYATYRLTCCGIRFFFQNVLIRDWIVECVPYPKTQKKNPVILSRCELILLIKYAPSDKIRLFILIAYSTGMRMMEIRHLRVNNIDSKRGCFSINHTKGKKGREIKLDKYLLIELRKYYRKHKLSATSLLIWGKDKSTPMDDSRIQRLVKKAGQDAGINKKVSPHCLRHSFATHFLEYGNTIKKLQHALGHKHISTTFTYIHYAEEHFSEYRSPLSELVAFAYSEASK